MESTFYPTIFSLLSHFTQPLFLPNREGTLSLLSSTSHFPMDSLLFNLEEGVRLDGYHSPKDPPLIPHQVLCFLFEFISQKVFKTLLCPISLHGAKI
jgi:hypothetical protein